jgi:hypothetical protein
MRALVPCRRRRGKGCWCPIPRRRAQAARTNTAMGRVSMPKVVQPREHWTCAPGSYRGLHWPVRVKHTNCFRTFALIAILSAYYRHIDQRTRRVTA